MKLSKLDRRDFIEAMLLLGLGACGGPRWGSRAHRSAPSSDAAMGRFYREMSRLSDDLVAGRITDRQYVARSGDRLMELELEEDVLEAWWKDGPVDKGVGRNGTRVLHERALGFGGRPGAAPGAAIVVLFYTPPGTTNPPHEHHNLMSCKRVLKGKYHVRQYERLRPVEPGVIAIRQVTELPDVGFGGPYIDMTDDRLNVHWFGAAGAEPTLALNIVVTSARHPVDTFHGVWETREAGQYYVDPTGMPDEEGIILAPSIGRDQALAFASRPLADFPSRLAGRGA
jgi:hypothetical protein